MTIMFSSYFLSKPCQFEQVYEHDINGENKRGWHLQTNFFTL